MNANGQKKDNDKPIGSVRILDGKEKPNGAVILSDRGIPGNGTGGGGGGGGHGEIEAARDDNIFVPRPGPVFVRGDVNGDSQINMQDAIAIVQWWNQQLQSGPPQWQPSCCPWTTNFPCHDAADANDDGYLTPEDALAIIRYLWANAMLSPPSSISLNYIASDCGEDLTEDDLGCDVESAVCN